MNLPAHITSGFDYAEAIGMAELTEHAVPIFERTYNGDVPDLYNTLYKYDSWRCVHAIRVPQARAWVLILQRIDQPQFALVFGKAALVGHTIPSVPDQAYTQPPPQDKASMPMASQPLTVTNVSAPDTPVRQRRQPEAFGAAEYPPITGELMPPPEDAMVYRPWLITFAAVQEEIELFFNALCGIKFVRPMLARLAHPQPAQRAAYMSAINAALAMRFGAEASAELMKALTQTLEQRNEETSTSDPIALANLLATEAATPPLWSIPATGFALYLTGHGAGGGVAALCVLYLKRKWESRIEFPSFKLKMYNFGSPKIGNRAFVDYYDQQMKGFSYRVQNLLDGATYEPSSQAPFPYNLPLLVPGIGKINFGAERFTTYEHIGEPFLRPGIGNPPLAFNFMKGFKPLLPLPFLHDPAGYKAMLLEAHAYYLTLSIPAQRVAARFNEGKNQVFALFYQQVTQTQAVIAKLQSTMTK